MTNTYNNSFNDALKDKLDSTLEPKVEVMYDVLENIMKKILEWPDYMQDELEKIQNQIYQINTSIGSLEKRIYNLENQKPVESKPSPIRPSIPPKNNQENRRPSRNELMGELKDRLKKRREASG